MLIMFISEILRSTIVICTGNALTVVKSLLHDPQGRLSSWDPNLVDPCSSWQGVTCINQHVDTV